MSRPTISLCVIARDEQETLPRCLESAAAWVDEMVVVDTGSTDDTVAAATKLKAVVVETPWNDDFAAARNAGLERCSGDFVLVLDADEWVAHGPDPRVLRGLLSAGPEAFSVELIDHLDGGAERHYPLVRLFRNRPEHRYRGAIHEQITPSIAERAGVRELTPEPSGLIVGHDGYQQERREARDKAERNLSLLRAWVAREPENASARYFLARELIPMRHGRAVPGEHLREALPHCEWLAAHAEALGSTLAADAARLHAAALLAEQRVDEARAVLDQRADRSVACELLRADADMMQAANRPEPLRSALARVEACFDRETRDRGPFSEPALAGPIARSRAAELLGALDEVERARELCEQAIGMPGSGAAPWSALASVQLGQGNLPAALKCYLSAIRCDNVDPWAWAGLGTVLVMVDRPRDAVEPLQNALRLAAGWREIERLLAIARDDPGRKVSA